MRPTQKCGVDGASPLSIIIQARPCVPPAASTVDAFLPSLSSRLFLPSLPSLLLFGASFLPPWHVFLVGCRVSMY